MQPKLLIFDWDGTLADTTNPIIETVQQAFYECGLAKPPADRIRNLIGRSLMQMMQQLAPSAGMGKYEELVETYAAHYLNPNNRHTISGAGLDGHSDAQAVASQKSPVPVWAMA